MHPNELTAAEAADLIKKRDLSCEELARSCLQRIERRDAEVRAWSFVDSGHAIRGARELDNAASKGPLHGLPVGIKDVIDTADMPTSQNSPLYFGHRAGKDAAAVAVVRHSGGLILGKTDTVEFATGGRKALTRNPHNLKHTPGGSSSGSAAAVADRQVPLAFGTQTGGSLIRPASFNGVYAVKPTYGVVSREGAKNSAHSLDTVGWYGRSVADLQLVANAFRLPGIGTFRRDASKPLKIGLCRTPMWERAEPSGRLALEAAGQRLAAAGHEVFDLDLPDGFERLPAIMDAIMYWEVGAAFLSEYLAFGPRLNQELRNMVENVKGITAEAMVEGYDHAAACRPAFDRLFAAGRLDVVLTLSAPGEAPEGLQNTGDWIFNSLWTLLHVPCVSIPAGLGGNNLPLGVQLVGPRFSDAGLLDLASAMAPVIDFGQSVMPAAEA